MKEPVKKSFQIGGKQVTTEGIEDWEAEEILNEDPMLPSYLYPVWDAFDCLGPEFSYELELKPHLDARCDGDADYWYWMEDLVMHLKKEYNKYSAEKLKRNRPAAGSKKKPQNKNLGKN